MKFFSGSNRLFDSVVLTFFLVTVARSYSYFKYGADNTLTVVLTALFLLTAVVGLVVTILGLFSFGKPEQVVREVNPEGTPSSSSAYNTVKSFKY